MDDIYKYIADNQLFFQEPVNIEGELDDTQIENISSLFDKGIIQNTPTSGYEAFLICAYFLHKKDKDIIMFSNIAYNYSYYHVAPYIAQYYKVVEPNKKMRLFHLEKGAENGDMLSAVELGIFYGKASPEKAIEYFDLAEKNNFIGVYLHSGYFYDDIKQHETAVQKFIYGCELGDYRNLLALGEHYFDVDNDIQLAEKYYLLAIEKNITQAYNNIALLYHNDYNDKIKAIEYYIEGIKSGCSNSMANLGILYENDNNFEKAEEYYLMAAEYGNVIGMYNLGNHYENKHEYDKSVMYFTMGANKKNIKSMQRLVNIYKNFIGNMNAAYIYIDILENMGQDPYKFDIGSPMSESSYESLSCDDDE